MSRRSPSPGSSHGSSDEDDAVDEGIKGPDSDAPRQKIWSWLHIAVSTGNLDKVPRHAQFQFV